MGDGSGQLDGEGRLVHLLAAEDLPRPLIEELMARAEDFLAAGHVTKTQDLRNKVVVTAFFEPSTRTRLAFEIAAKSLGAEVVDFDAGTSSLAAKGESFDDALRTIAALGADFIVLRLGADDAGAALATKVPLLPPGVALLNGGEGRRHHPSQAMLDLWTIQRTKGPVSDLRICIVGDIKNSRVARSLLHVFATMEAGAVVLSGPEHLLPEPAARGRFAATADMEEALAGADVVICLRNQYERMAQAERAATEAGSGAYLLTAARLALAKPDAVVMHPGPLNREVEIDSAVADSAQSLILAQVTNGVAMRMAIFTLLNEAL